MPSLIRTYEYEVDLDKQSIRRGKTVRRLSSVPWQILHFLIGHEGKSVSRADIMARVWPEVTVDPDTVSQHIHTIRAAFDERGMQVIRTIGRSRYQFFVVDPPGESRGLAHPSDIFQTPSGPHTLVQATEEDVRWIANFATRVYRAEEIPSEEVMLSWYEQNPNGFTIIKDRHGNSVGNLDFLPLKPATLKLFEAGRITEDGILADGLWSPDEQHRVRDLYLESFVAVRDPRAEPPKSCEVAARYALMNLDSVLSRICDPSRLTSIYAIAATASGRALLDSLDFEICSRSDQRRDKHDLYKVSFPRAARRLADQLQSPHLLGLLGGDKPEQGL